jgi:4'-phosphopantetheinyl transferase
MAPHSEAWGEPPGLADIGKDEAHVWRARLECSAERLRELEGWLHGDELERARRFRFPLHRERFVSRRGILRLLLGRYLRIAPADVEFEYTRYGKPQLARRHGTGLRFNLSHSHDLALFVLTRGREAGVDLERIRPDLYPECDPQGFFSAREVAALRALAPARRPAAFFELWVRKEAYMKAKGMGLYLALDSFDVSLGDAEPARLLRTAPDPRDAERWTMVALHPAPQYAGALVVQGPACVLRFWDCPGTRNADTPQLARTGCGAGPDPGSP